MINLPFTGKNFADKLLIVFKKKLFYIIIKNSKKGSK